MRPQVPRIAALLVALASAGCASWQPPAVQPAGPTLSFAAALSQGLPATVGVYGIGALARPDDAEPSMLGSMATERGERSPWTGDDANVRIGGGFFIATDGLVATAAHVVRDASRIIVMLPGRRVLPAELVAADDDADVAFVRIAATLPAGPPLGSSTALRPGDWVLAVGEPYGLGETVVAGIVGGRDRHFAEDGELLFIQSDLSLNPGNSGGPLLDMRGTIVGMNLRTVVGTYGSQGLSLSLPIEVVLQIARELASEGRIDRPRLGVAFEDVTPFAAITAGRSHAAGALISSVRPRSWGERLGLLPSDIVVGMNGRAIRDSADLARALLAWRSPAGTKLVVFRGGRYRHLAVPSVD